MTEKLYYKDSFQSFFEAVVEEIGMIDGRLAVVLNGTAFFPMGGGQECDTGFIGSTAVCETLEKDGIIYHFIEGEPTFSVGDTVACRIDFEQRFARMQAHSGEHIVSGIAHTLFGAENVGFHMEGLLMTVDFDVVLSKEDIAVLEKKANECVYADVKINTGIYSPAELADVDYRSKKDFDSDIRIVEIEGVDKCACCAPHVTRTGMIGIIKILSCVSHRGGVRLTLICGQEAYRDYADCFARNLRISSLLAAKHEETDIAVEGLLAQIKELKTAVVEQKKRLCAYIAASQPAADGNAVVFTEDCDVDELCEISLAVTEKCGGVSVACSGDDTNGYTYVITLKNGVMNQYAKQINAALNGRGGGRDEMIRGFFRASKKEISDYFEEFEVAPV